MNLDYKTLSTLTEVYKLDLKAVKAVAIKHLESGKSCQLEGNYITPNASALITELANIYMDNGKVPDGAVFSEDVLKFITSIFGANNRPDLEEQLTTKVLAEAATDIPVAIVTDIERHDTTPIKATHETTWSLSSLLPVWLIGSQDTSEVTANLDDAKSEDVTNIASDKLDHTVLTEAIGEVIEHLEGLS